MKSIIYVLFSLIFIGAASGLVVVEFVEPEPRDLLIDYEVIEHRRPYFVFICDRFGRPFDNGTERCVESHEEKRFRIEREQVKKGTLMVGGTPINYSDRYCKVINESVAQCISLTDGFHDVGSFNGCRPEGGQDCITIEVGAGQYSEYVSNRFGPKRDAIYRRGTFSYRGLS